MGRVLGRTLGHGKLDVALGPTKPYAPGPISNRDVSTAYILPSFFSLAALLIKINQFLSSKVVSKDEVDLDDLQKSISVILDTFDVEVTVVIPLHTFFC